MLRAFLKRKLKPFLIRPRRLVATSPVTDPGEAARLQALADSVPGWWHSIDFGQGVVTRGHKTREVIQAEIATFRLPNLQGKTVLDIGAWDGAYSFEAERRGARRVVALDHYVWSLDLEKTSPYWQKCQDEGLPLQEYHTLPEMWRPDTLPGKRGFDTACRALNSKVEAVVADFMEMDLDQLGQFDVVLFLGVLYHMKDPLAALQRLAALTREVAILETAAVVVPGMEQFGLCEFYETTELCGDPTNWWAPNRKALEGLCRAAGFRSVQVLTPALNQDRLPKNAVHRCRYIAHAWK